MTLNLLAICRQNFMRGIMLLTRVKLTSDRMLSRNKAITVLRMSYKIFYMKEREERWLSPSDQFITNAAEA